MVKRDCIQKPNPLDAFVLNNTSLLLANYIHALILRISYHVQWNPLILHLLYSEELDPQPPRYDPPSPSFDLIGLLRSWGGEWMWEHFEVVGNFDAIISAVKDGTALWCTDGSYDRSLMPDVSSAGWIIFDPATRSHIKGSFYELSPFMLDRIEANYWA